jgi:ABC-type oligopeptide transport system substrate-binding subunit
LLIDNETQSLTLAQTLIGQWKAALGCDPTAFNIVKVSHATVQEVAHGNVNTNANDAPPRADMWITSWTPDYQDANAWTGDAIHCRFGFLRTGISCGDADNLVDSAFLEKDPAKRAQDYDQAEDSWFGPMGTFPVAPLFVSVSFVGQQSWLKGATVNGPLRFDQWTLTVH